MYKLYILYICKFFPVTTFLGVRGEKITATTTNTIFKIGKFSSFKFSPISLG